MSSEGAAPEPAQPIEEVAAHLADSGQQLSNASLAGLNDLKSSELAYFKGRWPDIEDERRQQIVSRLVELAEQDPRLSFDVIFKDLLSDNDAAVRRLAVEGLWENEETAVISLLADVLAADSDTEVRAAAAKTLAHFAAMATLGKLRPEAEQKLRRVLFEATAEKNPTEVRRRAMEAAAPLNLPSLRDTIKEAYTSRDPRFKSSAIYAMGASGDPIWLPVLVAELKSQHPETRYEAATACGELADESTVPYLVKLLGDEDIEVRLAATRALGEIGGEAARKALQRCLQSSSDAVRELAAQALSQLEAAEEGLSFLLEEEEF